jgi:hypothetical protein
MTGAVKGYHALFRLSDIRRARSHEVGESGNTKIYRPV